MRLATEVVSAAADAQGVTLISRFTEPTLDGAPQPEEVESFDKVVVCSGVLSRQLGRLLGDRINVYPVKGYSITVSLPEDADQEAAPWVSLLDDKAKIVTSRLGQTRFRVAGTAEFNGYNRDIRAERIAPLVAWCRAHFPGMSTRQCVPWTGLRPMMPDMMPRVARGRNPPATRARAVAAGSRPGRSTIAAGSRRCGRDRPARGGSARREADHAVRQHRHGRPGVRHDQPDVGEAAERAAEQQVGHRAGGLERELDHRPRGAEREDLAVPVRPRPAYSYEVSSHSADDWGLPREPH